MLQGFALKLVYCTVARICFPRFALQEIKRKSIMPLPLAHAAIGAATNEILTEDQAAFSRLKTIIFVFLLSNLPDIDVIFGLLCEWNGNAYHRGLTHSLAFALLVGWIASMVWKWLRFFPKMSFAACFLIVLSHILADQFLTGSAVSMFWPLENNVSSGHSGWGVVFKAVAYGEMEDAGIIFAASIFIAAIRSIKSRFRAHAGTRKYGPRSICSGSAPTIR
jgi:membrane-bound metal-dependent hydrolase YbcI (DUF457 family)